MKITESVAGSACPHHDGGRLNTPEITPAARVLIAALMAVFPFLAQGMSFLGQLGMVRILGTDWLLYWPVLVLVIPSLISMTVFRLDHLRTVGLIVICFALTAVLAVHAGGRIETGPVTGARGAVMCSMFLLLVLALPWIQLATREGFRSIRYDWLCEVFWQNMTVLLALVVVEFLGHFLVWAIFVLIDGDVGGAFVAGFSALLIFPALGAVFAWFCIAVRTRHRFAQNVLQWMLTLATLVWPVVVVAVLILLGWLLMTGSRLLGNIRLLPIVLIVAMILCANAVWWRNRLKNSLAESPYPRVLRWLLDAGLLLLPVLAGFALHDQLLLAGQRGLSAVLLLWMMMTGVLALMALGYAWAALRRKGGWLDGLRHVNVAASLLAIILLILFNTPLFDLDNFRWLEG